MITELFLDKIASPIGTILLVADETQLCALDYEEYEQRMRKLLRRRFRHLHFKEVNDPCGFSSRLRAYLKGDVGCIDDLPVNPGGTSFQQEIWSALRGILPGTVMTYGELAKQLQRPTAYRAVGMTNALNPIAIVIPCHRLVGASGSLTGYAGGLERKRWLLEHEGVNTHELKRDTPTLFLSHGEKKSQANWERITSRH
jgi:methylated-DNA-[protein]-cysteine S-methyltransferase